MATRVIISSDTIRDYQFPLALGALLWREAIGYEPLLLLAGDWRAGERSLAALSFIESIGLEYRFVGTIPSHETSTYSQGVRQHAAVYDIPEETWLMSSDADMFPLRRDFYYQHEGTGKKLVLYFASGHHEASFPICHVTARAETWREVMGVLAGEDIAAATKRSIDSWLTPGRLAALAPEARATEIWMADQFQMTTRIRSMPWYPEQVLTIERGAHPPRLDRRSWPAEPYLTSTYTDAHLLRAAEQPGNWPRVRPIFEQLVPKFLPAIDAYRKAYVEAGEYVRHRSGGSPTPRVSVLIAARNRRDFLPACLDSVRRQTYGNHEIVLVDDGSTDGTAELAGLADVYRRTPPRGCSHARNLAMALARGNYLYVLDSDDYLDPRALELSVAAIEQTGSDMVFSDLFMVDASGRVTGTCLSREQSAVEVVEEKRIPHPSTMMRRRTLTIEYDEALPSAVDLDFLLRYMPGKVIKRIPTPLYYYRMHPGQLGASPLQNAVASGIRERWKAAAQATR